MSRLGTLLRATRQGRELLSVLGEYLSLYEARTDLQDAPLPRRPGGWSDRMTELDNLREQEIESLERLRGYARLIVRSTP